LSHNITTEDIQSMINLISTSHVTRSTKHTYTLLLIALRLPNSEYMVHFVSYFLYTAKLEWSFRNIFNSPVGLLVSLYHTASPKDLHCLSIENILYKKIEFFQNDRLRELNISETQRWNEIFFLAIDSSWSLLQKVFLKCWNSMRRLVSAINLSMSTPVDIGG